MPASQTTRINPATGRPFETHIVDGVPMMSRSTLAQIEATRARGGYGTDVAPTSPHIKDGNVVEHTVTHRVRLPDQMNANISGILGAIMTSPATAEIVTRGIGNSLASLQAQQPTDSATPLPYFQAERVQTPVPEQTAPRHATVPARVAGYPYGDNKANEAVEEAETVAEATGIRRIVGSVVVASVLAGSAWFTATTTLSMFGRGEIKNENLATMNWGELPDKFQAILGNPVLLTVPDRGDRK